MQDWSLKQGVKLSYSDNSDGDDSDNKRRETILVFTVTSLTSDPGEPSTYHAAITGPKRLLWIPSIREEIEIFLRRDAWKMKKLSTLPTGHKPIRTKWVFKKKNQHDGSTRYKSRCVVLGYYPIPGVNYTGAFSPVATDSSVRVVLVYALFMGWKLEVLDVEAAFLNAELDNLLYVKWPDAMLELGYLTKHEFNTTCAECSNAMYGTTDAPRA